MKDPPVRADGRCAHRGCTKRRVIPTSTYATREQHECDPFCSTECCREHHCVEMTVTKTSLGAGAGRRKVYA
jgi:hypothetical protein